MNLLLTERINGFLYTHNRKLLIKSTCGKKSVRKAMIRDLSNQKPNLLHTQTRICIKINVAREAIIKWGLVQSRSTDQWYILCHDINKQSD